MRPSGIRAIAVLAVVALLPFAANACRAQTASARQTSGAYELLTPAGAGPFPAVVVMHGCDGVNENTRRWAQRLVSWGYAALIVDSFRPRGLSSVCNRGSILPASVRAGDAVQAKGYLGVQIRLNPDGKGILIMEIQENSAAEKARLRAKDVILKIDGTEPTSLKEFIGILDLKQPGDEVTLDILRDGKEEKVKVTLGKMSG